MKNPDGSLAGIFLEDLIKRESYGDECKNLVGNSILSAAFITYCGFFDQVNRASLLDKWKEACENLKIGFNSHISISEFLIPHYQLTKWQEYGLKNDRIAMENGTILSHCKLYPFIIDPSLMISQYLMKQFQDQKIIRSSFQDSNFLKILENAVRFGSPLLIEDVERLDPILLTILSKEIRKTSGRSIIRIGSKDIDFCPTFKLFLVTKNPDIVLPPAICSRLTLVNFTVTRSSLKNEILDRTLESERPDISEKRLELLKLQGEYQLKLRVLEDQLLESLNSSKGKILNDEIIIDHLEGLQSEASELSCKSTEANENLIQIEKAANHYSEFSQKCSDIFFLLERLSLLNKSYQFSLEWFLTIFKDILGRNQKLSVDAGSSLTYLLDAVLRNYFERVAISLLQEHRLTFLFGLFELKNNLGNIVDPQWMDVLLGRDICLRNEPIELPEFISQSMADNIKSLLHLRGFGQIIEDIRENSSIWKAFFNDPLSEIEKISAFQSDNGMIIYSDLFFRFRVFL